VASRPKFRSRHRPQIFGLGLASISLSYYVIGHFSGKSHVKFGNFVNFSGNNLKPYVINHNLVLFHNNLWLGPWPQPPEIGLGLVALASASRFWPRLTSLIDTSGDSKQMNDAGQERDSGTKTNLPVVTTTLQGFAFS